jgi:NAD(P)-dependent dehydrogenase (short-subunit alcohol dehydrogenase family)
MSTLVTGAGGGIGAEIVRQLVDSGETVVAQDVNPRSLAQVQGPAVLTTAGDLLERGYLDGLGRLAVGQNVDRVIATHGIDGSAALEDATPDFVRKVMEVNAESITLLLAVTLEGLKRSGGTFVVVASQAGLHAEANNVAYCASKFAIVGWVMTLAPSLEREGVSLRAFCPGCTETPLLFAAQERFAAAAGLSAVAFIEARKRGIPIQRFAQVRETAAGAIYLAARGGRRPRILAASGGEVLH